jgi:hypothetical protein
MISLDCRHGDKDTSLEKKNDNKNAPGKLLILHALWLYNLIIYYDKARIISHKLAGHLL